MIQQCCVIFTTTNDQQVVDQIIIKLFAMNLVSCVQIDDIVSYFRWDGKISSEKEYRIMIKARSDNYNKIEHVIMGLHNYELPQIIKLNIADGLPAYLNYINGPTVF